MKPRLLITIYANPDHYPPTINAIAILRNHFEVHVLCRNSGEPDSRWPSDVAVERLGSRASVRDKEGASSGAKIAEYLHFVVRTRSLIAQLKPALIYAYDAHAFVAALFARSRRQSISLILHMHELAETQGLPLTSMQRWVVKAASLGTKSADVVVFPEKFRALSWLKDAGDPRAAVIVPNCPARNSFPAPLDLERSIAERFAAREALYVGCASRENGHLEALRAMQSLESDLSLRVIGDHTREFAETFSVLARELGAADRINFDGWLPREELIARASRASIGLSLHKPHSKNFEYLGSASNKLFEYAAMALPVVVPNSRSYRDFLGEARWVTYADVENPTSIARAISSILSDRARYIEMSLAARHAFETEFFYERAFAPALERIDQLVKCPSSMRSPEDDPSGVPLRASPASSSCSGRGLPPTHPA
jgi:glycosyltransferase involved in cell wall biosynthesis